MYNNSIDNYKALINQNILIRNNFNKLLKSLNSIGKESE